jgi:hypothetical protein
MGSQKIGPPAAAAGVKLAQIRGENGERKHRKE